ncbi:MAG TPA: ATP-binding protein [Verrucomicrobiae bacterium]|nr:ATP-binding protein [Verrucomicrobiae bacterium]
MTRDRMSVYTASLAALFAALFLRGVIDPWIGDAHPFSTLYAAIALAVWVGGARPAIVIALLGYAPATWLFVSPRGTLAQGLPGGLLALTLYCITAAIVIGFGEAMRREGRRADEARREAERHGARFEESEARFRTLADAAPVLIWMTDETGRCVLVNAPYRSGADPGSAEHDAWDRLLHPEDRAGWDAAVRTALATRGAFRHEARLRGRDGATRWFELSGRPRLERSRFLGHVGTGIDVTERREALAAAAESGRRLAAELEAMRHLHALSTRLLSAKSLEAALDDVLEGAIAISGADCGNVQILDAATGHLRIAAQRGLRPEFLDHFADVAVGEGSACARALAQGERLHVEDVGGDPEFEPHRAVMLAAGIRAVQSTPLKAADGSILGMLSTHFRQPHLASERDARLLDLVARHTADLIGRFRHEAEMKSADRCKDEFLATLAHELRNPLAPIRNAVQIFKAKAPREPDLTWGREVIERQVAQMARLLDDLLDVSRISRNRFDLRRARVPLREILQNAVETSRPLIAEARHALEVVLPEEPVQVDGDPARLAQVFLNLLNNAARYTPEGGRIRVQCEISGTQVVVAVSDTGVGIAPEMLPRIFDMFSQGEASRERSRLGLGVGLALARSLVELHGGSIEARSAGLARGSTFVVRLPRAAAAAASAEPRPASVLRPATIPAKRRVLIVDDLKDNAESLARLLGFVGHEVHIAFDGEEGIAAAERVRPDVVLLDIGMPRLNGYDACRRIRQQPWGRDMVMIAVTGWGQEHDRHRSEEAGFARHLVKPVDPGDLLALLDALPPRDRVVPLVPRGGRPPHHGALA